MNQSIVIHRSGAPPLAFVGELIAGAEPSASDTGERWHTIDVYRTTGGAYVVEVNYQSDRRGETDHTDAQSFADLGAAVAWLRSYNPVGYVTGWPPLPVYADRQARLMLELRERFAQLVTQVLAQIPAAKETVP